MDYRLSHLRQLEAEAIHVIREVAAEFRNPMLLYSGGKDSACLVHLARKAFWPGRPPFPLLHVATTWDFGELLAFRDRYCRDHGLELIVHTNEEALAAGVNPFDFPTPQYSAAMQTQALVQALKRGGFDAAFGGARRDEEKSRAKERIFSFRSRQMQWDPRNQRPELWGLYNGKVNPGESIRAFPLSNWTELDVWLYVHRENIPLPDLYYAHEREVFGRDGMWLAPGEWGGPKTGEDVQAEIERALLHAVNEGVDHVVVDDGRMRLEPGERPVTRTVRFRTLGCYPLTAATESAAVTVPQVIEETLLARASERNGRLIDYDEAGSMEQKKREGYF